MKETGLGEFEEIILLLVGILGEDVYAFKIVEEFKGSTGRTVSVGSVHATLSRLSDRGFLRSKMKHCDAVRGGRRKCIYRLTGSGQHTLARYFRT